MLYTGHIQGLNVGELKQYRVHNLSATPGSLGAGNDGLFWWNSTVGDKRIYFWDNVAGAGIAVPRLDRAETVTAAWNFNAYFTVPGTTKVTNLNADLLDGFNSSATAVENTIPIYTTGGALLVADPTAAGHAASKGYVDSVAQGLDVKGSCRVATAAALPANTRTSNTLTASANGSINSTGIDGVTTLAVNDRVLVKDEATGANNGLFIITALGDASNPWTMLRTTDADVSSEVTAGLYTFVGEGSTQANTSWILTTDDPITLNTTALVFAKFSGAGQITAGNGIVKVGDTLHFAQSASYNQGGFFYASSTAAVGHTAALTGIIQGNGTSAPTAITGTANMVPRWASTGPYLTGTGSIFDDASKVGIGTAAPKGAAVKLHIARNTNADTNWWTSAPLVVEDNTSAYINVRTPNTASGGIMFSDPDATYSGLLEYGHTNNEFVFYTAGTIKWRMLSTGIWQSEGAQTIQSSAGILTVLGTGGLTLSTAANTNILLTPNGTGVTSVASKLIVGATSSNFVLEVNSFGGSALGVGAKVGLASIGQSSNLYPLVGYGVRFRTDATYDYDATDFASFIKFQAGGHQFFTAPSGTVGVAMTPVLRWEILNASTTLQSNGAGTIQTSSGGLTIQPAGNTVFATTSGSVCIGGATFDANLRVSAAGLDNGLPNILVNASFSRADNTTGIILGYRTDETTGIIAPRTATGNLAFLNYNGAAWIETMRLTSAGNIGFGTPSPDFRGDFAGHVRIESANKLYFGGTGAGDTLAFWYGSAANTLRANAHLVPDATITHDTGSAALRWRKGYYEELDVTRVGDELSSHYHAKHFQGSLHFYGTANTRAHATLTGYSVGTNDFALRVKFRVPSSNPGGSQGIIALSSSNSTAEVANACVLYLHSSGVVEVRLFAGTVNDFRVASITKNAVATWGGKIVEATITRTGTTLAIYINAVSEAYTEATGGTPPTWGGSITSTHLLVGIYSAAVIFSGEIRAASLFNYALSAAQVGDVVRFGVPFADQWTSDAELIADSDDRNFATSGHNWVAFGTGASVAHDATNFELDVTTGATVGVGAELDSANWGGNTTVGKRYRWTHTIRNISSGTLTVLVLNANEPVNAARGNGTFTEDFVAGGVGNKLRFKSNSASQTWSTDDISLKRLGAVVDLDLHNAGAGFANDRSSNKFDATLVGGITQLQQPPAARIVRDGIGETQSDAWGLALINNTLATASLDQFSPAIRQRAHGWKTNATAASQSIDFRQYVQTFSGDAAPLGFWTLESAVNGAAYGAAGKVSFSDSGGLALWGNNEGGGKDFSIYNYGGPFDSNGSYTRLRVTCNNINGGSPTIDSASNITSAPSIYFAFNGVKTCIINRDGKLGIGGMLSPTAYLHLPAGSASAATAPLKFTSGALMTTAENGAVEYDSTKFQLWFTRTSSVYRRMVSLGYSTTIGDGAAISYTVTHNLGTRRVLVQVVEEGTPYAQIVPDQIERATDDTVTVKFLVAPTTNQYRVLVASVDD